MALCSYRPGRGIPGALYGKGHSDMRLQGKTVIITGAAAGIGAASAELFASEGAIVVAVDLDRTALDGLSARIANAGGTCLAMRGDVSQRDDVHHAVEKAIEHFGRVNILFNNAGIVPTGKVDAIDEEQWDRAMAINVKSMYLFCHALIPHFKKQGGGGILNTAPAK